VSLRRLIFLAIALTLSALAELAGAAEPTLAVLVETSDARIQPRLVREAIAAELGLEITETASSETLGTLEIQIRKRDVTILYREGDAPPLSRTMPRPSNPADDLEVIALLAGNLARDEARELAKILAARQAPSEVEPEVEEPPEPARPTPKPRARPRPEEPAPAPAAPAEEDSALPLSLSLFHPLSLHPDSERRSFHLSFGLAYSRIGSLRGAAVEIGLLRTDRMLQGAAVSAIGTWSRGATDGVTVAGLFAVGEGRLRGAELSSLFNVRAAEVQGAQVAAGFNRASAPEGAQLAAGLNLAGKLQGVQLALVNVGEEVTGVQLGLVNVAGRVRGTQIGLLNVARRVDGLSAAPVSILAENRSRLLVWSDTLLLANAGVAYSSDRLYSLVAFGGDPLPQEDRSIAGGGGIGVHLLHPGKGSELFLDLDLLYRFVRPEQDPHAHTTTYRLLAGWQLTPGFAAVAGGGIVHRVERGEHEALPYGAIGMQGF
jgi:hypothetical protein